jgi:hypothetical protein
MRLWLLFKKSPIYIVFCLSRQRHRCHKFQYFRQYRIIEIFYLQYKAMEGILEEISRDYCPNWMTAVEMLSDDT